MFLDNNIWHCTLSFKQELLFDYGCFIIEEHCTSSKSRRFERSTGASVV